MATLHLRELPTLKQELAHAKRIRSDTVVHRYTNVSTEEQGNEIVQSAISSEDTCCNHYLDQGDLTDVNSQDLTLIVDNGLVLVSQSLSGGNTAVPCSSVMNSDSVLGSSQRESSELSREIEPQQDQICFGMLTAPVCDLQTRSLASKVSTIPVHFNMLAEPLQLMSIDKFVLGTLHPYYSKLVRVLNKQPEINLQSYITLSTTTQRQNRAKRSLKETKSLNMEKAELSVILYGPTSLFNLVGEYFDKCMEYLQLPLNCDRNVEYRNPQSLSGMDERPRMTFHLLDKELPLQVTTIVGTNDPSAILETERVFPETDPPDAVRTLLYSHQKQAISFMLSRERGWDLQSDKDDIWKAVPSDQDTAKSYFNTVTEMISSKPPGQFFGGILADSMGLGKSLTMISLFASDYSHRAQTIFGEGIKGANLLVVPLSLLRTWESEILRHLRPGTLTFSIYHRSEGLAHITRLLEYDIILTTYDVVASQWRKLGEGIQTLFSIEWRRIVLDEAHEIREATTNRAKAVCSLRGKARWAITGTPIQNRLQDLTSLINFLKVFPEGDLKVLKAILRSEKYVKRLLNPICLRRSKKAIQLPGRTDEIHTLEFNREEAEEYNNMNEIIMKHLEQAAIQLNTGSYANTLAKINALRQICNLGTLYKGCVINETIEEDFDVNKAQDLFNSMLSTEMAICARCMQNLGTGDNDSESTWGNDNNHKPSKPLLFSCGKVVCPSCLSSTDSTVGFFACRCESGQICRSFPVMLFGSVYSPSFDLATNKLPVKMRALQQDLLSLPRSDKSIVFSSWTSTLEIIEQALGEVQLNFTRVDGTMQPKQRQKAFEAFRYDPNIRVILISLRCGSNGLNLTAANHVFLMEPQWNPMLEDQALDRVYRIGQNKEVTTVRYIVKGTLEESIRNQQIEKRRVAEQALSSSHRRTDWIQQIRSMLSTPLAKE